MTMIVYVLAIFSLSLFFHIVIHRILAKRGILTLKSIAPYVVGFIAVGLLAILGTFELRVTSLLLYTLFSLVAIMFYLTPYLGGETPASMILASFKKRKQQSMTD